MPSLILLPRLPVRRRTVPLPNPLLPERLLPPATPPDVGKEGMWRFLSYPPSEIASYTITATSRRALSSPLEIYYHRSFLTSHSDENLLIRTLLHSPRPRAWTPQRAYYAPANAPPPVWRGPLVVLKKSSYGSYEEIGLKDLRDVVDWLQYDWPHLPQGERPGWETPLPSPQYQPQPQPQPLPNGGWESARTPTPPAPGHIPQKVTYTVPVTGPMSAPPPLLRPQVPQVPQVPQDANHDWYSRFSSLSDPAGVVLYADGLTEQNSTAYPFCKAVERPSSVACTALSVQPEAPGRLGVPVRVSIVQDGWEDGPYLNEKAMGMFVGMGGASGVGIYGNVLLQRTDGKVLGEEEAKDVVQACRQLWAAAKANLGGPGAPEMLTACSPAYLRESKLWIESGGDITKIKDEKERKSLEERYFALTR
ncbi:hypothetical protein BJ508DRAFT_365518 [Ascobolus immersus RN42]|uniref:Uncharacterized protein n=1 Tax=Ascobolus immersus RN42 TaxID=1160509 RepID=A0A3N4HPC5_ASCIM|nr:hypothetical protein BJ508DRAFT_365518 [Ascobolus immersus RN42]